MKAYILKSDSQGAAAVIISILIAVLIGFAALALDVGHIMVVRGELQNAADAGALAGARVLYALDESGNVTGLNPDAASEARAGAIANNSDNNAVEVTLATDVQLGNWDGTVFTPSASTDPAYINAVRVTTHRSTPYAILAGIFGTGISEKSASAIAYMGYAGSDVEYDMPIAICLDMLLDSNGNYVCSTGRMFSNGGGASTVGTARWTNFSEQCVDPANSGNGPYGVPTVVELGCSGGISPFSLTTISTSDGEMTPALREVRDCWLSKTGGTASWELTLPVVECVSPPNCSQITGAVKVKVLWVTPNGTDSQYNNIPISVDGWSQSVNCSGMALATLEGRQQCWNNFVDSFNLRYMNPDGTLSPATYQPATLYFKPACDYTASGGPGGGPFSVLAEHPKLVQ